MFLRLKRSSDVMLWDALRGHRAQLEMFRRSIRRGRWSQAYLFVGPEGIGKRAFARLLAQCLFCTRVPDEELDACGECSDCRMMRAGTHPDYLSVSRPEGKNALPIKLFIGEGETRGREGLCHDIALRPMSATRRMAVVDDAHLMQVEAANAILKTLEEPPPYATLILVVPEPDALLATIRSRCQQIRFSPLTAEDVAAVLLEQELVADAGEARRVAALSDGSLDTAQQLLNPQLQELREILEAHLRNGAFDALALSRQALESLGALGSEAAVQRQNAVWLLRFAAEHFRSALRAAEDPERIANLLSRLAEAEGDIQRNVSVPLSLEALFADIGRGLRRQTVS